MFEKYVYNVNPESKIGKAMQYVVDINKDDQYVELHNKVKEKLSYLGNLIPVDAIDEFNLLDTGEIGFNGNWYKKIVGARKVKDLSDGTQFTLLVKNSKVYKNISALPDMKKFVDYIKNKNNARTNVQFILLDTVGIGLFNEQKWLIDFEKMTITTNGELKDLGDVFTLMEE